MYMCGRRTKGEIKHVNHADDKKSKNRLREDLRESKRSARTRRRRKGGGTCKKSGAPVKPGLKGRTKKKT